MDGSRKNYIEWSNPDLEKNTTCSLSSIVFPPNPNIEHGVTTESRKVETDHGRSAWQENSRIQGVWNRKQMGRVSVAWTLSLLVARELPQRPRWCVYVCLIHKSFEFWCPVFFLFSGCISSAMPPKLLLTHVIQFLFFFSWDFS